MWRRLLLTGGTFIVGLLLLRKAFGRPFGPRRVATLGDSITAAGWYTKALLPLLPKGSVVQAFGYGGKQVRVIHRHLPEALAWKPTDVVVLAGVNDLASGRSSTQVLNDLRALWTDAKVANVRVIAVTILPWARWRTVANRYVEGGLPFGNDKLPSTREVNAGILANALPDVAVATDSLGDENGRLLTRYDGGDGLHPNVAGHRALARLIAEAAF